MHIWGYVGKSVRGRGNSIYKDPNRNCNWLFEEHPVGQRDQSLMSTNER